MIPQYFIATLPRLSSAFYKKVERLHELKCYPEFRLPFHATLFYFGILTADQINKLNHWLESKRGMAKIRARVKGISHFDNGGKLIYFLELESLELEKMNKELRCFGIGVNSPPFKPHLSLFFPLFELSNADENLLKKTFKSLKEIEFEAIYLASAINHVYQIHKNVPLF